MQSESQKFWKVMLAVSSAKAFLWRSRDDKWDDLLSSMKSVCEACIIDILDRVLDMLPDKVELIVNKKILELRSLLMIYSYVSIYFQLQELNNQFSNHVIQLLILS